MLMHSNVMQKMPDRTRYPNIVRSLIERDARSVRPGHGEIEPLALADDQHGSYMLVYLGWSGDTRHHDVIVHARVRDGKVWIERDGTVEGFANALTQAGIPAEDIVLAFHHPRKRPHTGYAVG
jgi:hypothetical protein